MDEEFHESHEVTILPHSIVASCKKCYACACHTKSLLEKPCPGDPR